MSHWSPILSRDSGDNLEWMVAFSQVHQKQNKQFLNLWFGVGKLIEFVSMIISL
jgi:hypothetical protein